MQKGINQVPLLQILGHNMTDFRVLRDGSHDVSGGDCKREVGNGLEKNIYDWLRERERKR